MSGEEERLREVAEQAAILADRQAFEADQEISRLKTWLLKIKDTGCFVVSGEKRTHAIPNPTCKACMAARALAGDPAPK